MTGLRNPSLAPETLAEVENDNQHQSNSRFAAYAASLTFFTMFITPRSVPLFLGQVASKIILPLAAFASMTNLYYKYREWVAKRKLDRQSEGFYSLVVDAAMNIGIAAAVLTAFLISAPIASVIMATSLLAKSAWELAMAAKDAYQAFNMPSTSASETSLNRKNELYRKAATHLANSVIIGSIGAALSLMAYAGFAAFTLMGLAASAGGLVLESRLKEENSNLGIVELTGTPPTHSYSNNAINNALRINHGFGTAHTIVPVKYFGNLEAVKSNTTSTLHATATAGKGGAPVDVSASPVVVDNEQVTFTRRYGR